MNQKHKINSSGKEGWIRAVTTSQIKRVTVLILIRLFTSHASVTDEQILYLVNPSLPKSKEGLFFNII